MKEKSGTKRKRLNRNRICRLSGVLCVLLLLAGCGSGADGARKEQDVSVSEEKTQESQTGDEGADQADSGVAMPAFTAKDLDGNTVTESIFGDKDLTVVNIWGTFCGPCVREMPELGAWAKEMPDNVQIVGLIIDINGDDDTQHRDLAVEITQNAGADFLNIIANADFADVLKGVVGVPTTIFVDKDGNIVGDAIVGADVDGYKAFVEEYLNGQ